MGAVLALGDPTFYNEMKYTVNVIGEEITRRKNECCMKNLRLHRLPDRT